jgi:hypothetical protein
MVWTRSLTLLGLVVGTLWASPARAESVGWITLGGGADASSAIAASGNTPVALVNLDAASIAGLDVIWVLNSDNGGYDAVFTSNLAAIASYVQAGGVFVLHDRTVADAGGAFPDASAVLPGGAAIAFLRDFSDDANIDVLDPTGLLANGAGGTIDNSTLDGGNSSSHGYALLGTLPAGTVALLSQGDPTHVVDFRYALGGGAVHYSSIPLDFYLGGGSNFSNIYAPNLVAFSAAFAPAVVPEPGTIALFGLAGLAGAGALARRRRKQPAR